MLKLAVEPLILGRLFGEAGVCQIEVNGVSVRGRLQWCTRQLGVLATFSPVCDLGKFFSHVFAKVPVFLTGLPIPSCYVAF